MVDGTSIRQASREFGLHRDTVRKMLKYAAPPGYQRRKPPRKTLLLLLGRLAPGHAVADAGLGEDVGRVVRIISRLASDVA